MAIRGLRKTLKRSQDTISSPIGRLRLTDAEEAMMPMVFLRSQDAQLSEPILDDPYCKEILERCETDLSAKHFIEDVRFMEYVMNRTKHLDVWCQVCGNL